MASPAVELTERPHSVTFEAGLSKTIDWYLENEAWIENVRSGEYKAYYDQMYGERLS